VKAVVTLSGKKRRERKKRVKGEKKRGGTSSVGKERGKNSLTREKERKREG